MKTIGSGLLALLTASGDSVLPLNTCVLITRVDSTVFGFTDCDVDLTVSGQVYKAATGFFGAANQNSNEFNVDQTEITGRLDAAALTEADIMAGKWDDATVRMFQVSRTSPSAGTYEMRYGRLGQVTIKAPGEFLAELRGLTQFLQKQIGRLITPTCRWTLGDQNAAGTVVDSHCTVNLASYAVTGVAVTGTITGNQQFSASSLSQPAGYFQAGYLTWTSGLNNGRSQDIQGSGTSGAIVLQLPMLNLVQIGDTFTIYPGCQKRLQQDCIGKFSNGINHGGFPYVPGIDKMVRPGGV